MFPKFINVEFKPKNWQKLDNVNENKWIYKSTKIELLSEENGFSVEITSPDISISRIQLSWENEFCKETLFSGDAFERGYGDISYQFVNPEKKYYWYLLAKQPNDMYGLGIKVQPNSFCNWTVCDQSIDLWIDIRNGVDPIKLNERTLSACAVVRKKLAGRNFLESHKQFCELLAADITRIEPTPIVGSNDWNYAYGNNDYDLIVRQAELMRELTDDINVSPWVVIDDGWQVNHSESYNGGPWNKSNEKFPSMEQLATDIQNSGCESGIWIRPLLTNEKISEDCILHNNQDGTVALDPSHPLVLEKVKEDFKNIVSWGYRLIKQDFTTHDIFGQFGPEMELDYFNTPIEFYDKSVTTAEIVKKLYKTMAEVDEAIEIIACNTISHLSAGIFSIMRIGDDTSGRSFPRTRKYGVNSLAARLPQDNHFYSIDPDCVGISEHIPWDVNKKWLDLVVKSGTALFISADPELISEEIKSDLKKGIMTLIENTGKTVVPKDFIYNMYPSIWEIEGETTKFNWFENPREFYDSFG